MKKKSQKDALLGTLDLLILRVVSNGPIHGYGIARRIEQVSEQVLMVKQGSLYPALHRLEKKAYVQSEWQSGEGSKPIKVYSLTEDGKKELEDEISYWETVSKAVNIVLQFA